MYKLIFVFVCRKDISKIHPVSVTDQKLRQAKQSTGVFGTVSFCFVFCDFHPFFSHILSPINKMDYSKWKEFAKENKFFHLLIDPIWLVTPCLQGYLGIVLIP